MQEEAYRPDPLAQAIANIIKADPDTYLDMFNFRSEICISCDWRRMELSPKVTNFAGHSHHHCQMACIHNIAAVDLDAYTKVCQGGSRVARKRCSGVVCRGAE